MNRNDKYVFLNNDDVDILDEYSKFLIKEMIYFFVNLQYPNIDDEYLDKALPYLQENVDELIWIRTALKNDKKNIG